MTASISSWGQLAHRDHPLTCVLCFRVQLQQGSFGCQHGLPHSMSSSSTPLLEAAHGKSQTALIQHAYIHMMLSLRLTASMPLLLQKTPPPASASQTSQYQHMHCAP